MAHKIDSEGHLDFWAALDALLTSHEIVIERRRGSTHPRYPDITYPLDYGYLEGTRSTDGSGIDVWLGSVQDKVVHGVILTVDLEKSDSEVKVLLGCDAEETETILSFHNKGKQSAILISNENLRLNGA